ncbi:MAG: hypothetical protein AAGD32_15680 [Planctomycetota bacterium]
MTRRRTGRTPTPDLPSTSARRVDPEYVDPDIPEPETHRTYIESDQPVVFMTADEAGTKSSRWFRVMHSLIDTGMWAQMGPSARAVYLPLAKKAAFSETYVCEVSYPELSKLSGISVRQCYRGIADLKAMQLVAQTRHGKNRPQQEINRYQLLVPVAPDTTPQSTQCHSRQRGSDKNVSGKRVADDSGAVSRKALAQSRRRRTPNVTSGSLIEKASENSSNNHSRPEDVVVVLVKLGIAPRTATALAEDFDAEAIMAYVEAFRLNREEGRRYTPGWLVDAIREGWKVKHLAAAKRKLATAKPEPKVDPFEAAWARVPDLDDATFDDLRHRVIESAESEKDRKRLVQADRDHKYLRSCIAELLLEQGGAG